MKNLLKEKMDQNQQVLGTFFESGSISLAECLGHTGLDFFIVDTEHGPFDVESTADFIRAAELNAITPLVRIKEISRSAVLKMLDIGAKGLIIPCVETVEEVKNLVEYGKYFPLGKRGFAPARAAGFGFKEFAKNVPTYFETCNRETLLIPQCETLGCLKNIEEIVNIDGVDGIFVGPYDLSIAMGKPAQFDNPELIEAIQLILETCRKAGKYSFIYGGTPEKVSQYFADGFQGVTYSMDTIIYTQAFQKITAELRP